MNVAARTLFRLGAGSSLVEDFRALAEATAPNGEPRYRDRPLLEDLARFVARGGGGPNRDAAFYELCHLVNAVEAAGTGRDRRNAFFLEPEAATPVRFQARLDRALARGGWRRTGFHRAREGLAIQYPDGAFTIRFARMPFLAALYEFLVGMEDFSFYGELESIFTEMTQAPADIKRIQVASNRIASHFRHVRRRHLSHAQHEGKFDALMKFTVERSPTGMLVIDDASVLAFWMQKSAAGDFRAYRTVFDAFASFLKALEENARSEAMAQAAPIGVDREQGEVEPDDTCAHVTVTEEWVSPLALLDSEPADAIKFLKKEGERKPMEALMQYGPAAIRLPLAFLRLEAFGPVQAAITTDLQIGRRERIEERASCGDADTYGEIITRLENLLALVRRLHKAVFYALHKGSQETPCTNVVPVSAAMVFDQARSMIEQARDLPDTATLERLAADAARTFRSIARKGFDETELGDETRRRGFEIGASALVAAASHLESYLAASRRVGTRSQALDRWFDADRSAFSERFRVLYGVRQ